MTHAGHYTTGRRAQPFAVRGKIRRPMRSYPWMAGGFAVLALAVTASAQLGDSSFEQLDHPAIDYINRAPRDSIAALTRRIQSGSVKLTFEAGHGYLPSLLKALDIPIESQVAVFSKTSTQMNLIHPRNPRMIYFNDLVSVAWVRGAFVLEIAAQDPEQGTIFYELDQQAADTPTFIRTRACLRCHHSFYTNGIPGRLMRSTLTASDGTTLGWTRNASDHATPFEERWAGWYVTGKLSGMPHLGNTFATSGDIIVPGRSADVGTLADKFDTTGYLTPFSDVVALLVLEHQSGLTNLLTRLDWEMRAAAWESRPGAGAALPIIERPRYSVDKAINEIADYLLFVNETPLPGPVQGTSGFAERFSAEGPFDSRGRSLRQLDLQHRLLRYPCSYLIYAPMFDELPAQAREAIYRRMWQILSGGDPSEKYARLSAADRAAVIDILHDTKKGLPAYFHH